MIQIVGSLITLPLFGLVFVIEIKRRKGALSSNLAAGLTSLVLMIVSIIIGTYVMGNLFDTKLVLWGIINGAFAGLCFYLMYRIAK